MTVLKNPRASSEDTGLNPWVGRSRGEGYVHPSRILPENPMGRGGASWPQYTGSQRVGLDWVPRLGKYHCFSAVNTLQHQIMVHTAVERHLASCAPGGPESLTTQSRSPSPLPRGLGDPTAHADWLTRCYTISPVPLSSFPSLSSSGLNPRKCLPQPASRISMVTARDATVVMSWGCHKGSHLQRILLNVGQEQTFRELIIYGLWQMVAR